ncbi:hypothetical protein FCK90_12630 [Kocuria coralli]|uniref:Zinc metalloprotease n=1 Tax=Kocuria coralli TaxID=1461025 RepID=A0A5J5KVT2_9MICC|nr:site-2 protease family protein [Kocuria coralli]KAA9393350.1 hypothetical protein FCK90_12630 [Kocuria coralli]
MSSRPGSGAAPAPGGDQPPRAAGRWRRPLSLGRVTGFPVLVDRSWFLIAAVVILLYTPVLARSVPQIGAWSYAVAAGFCVLLAASVLLHELAHAWAARAFGWPVTHIVLSLMGGHTSFGQARTSWVASLVISVVGPAANILLGVLGWTVLRAGAGSDPSTGAAVALVLVELVTWANLFVGIFNLIPGMPLDGGRALEALVWGLSGKEHIGTVVAAWAGRLVAAGVLAWLLLTGLWRSLPFLLLSALLVWLLLSGAAAATRRARAGRAMASVRARDLMEPCLAVSAETSLATVEVLLREAFSPAPGSVAPQGPVAVLGLDHDGVPHGVLNPARITAVPAQDRASIVLGEVMEPLPDGAVLSAELAEMALLEFTAGARLGIFVVVDGEHTPVGVLRASRLNELLRSAGLLR